jgi:hypothetical protein
MVDVACKSRWNRIVRSEKIEGNMRRSVAIVLVALGSCGGTPSSVRDAGTDQIDARENDRPAGDIADVAEDRAEGVAQDVANDLTPGHEPGRLFDNCLAGWPNSPATAPLPVPSLDIEARVLWSKPLATSGSVNRPILATSNGVAIALFADLYLATKEGVVTTAFHSAAPGVLAPPVADPAGNLYVADAGYIYSLDSTGAERWRRPVGANASQGEFAFPSYGLLAEDGTLYWNMLDGGLWRVRSTDGSPRGPAAALGLRGGARYLIAGVGQTVFVGDDDGGLSLVNAETGAWGPPVVDESGWRPLGIMGGSRIGLVAYGYVAGDASETQVFDPCGRPRWKVPGSFSRPVAIGFDDQLVVRDRVPMGTGFAESVRKFSADGALIAGPESTGSVAGGVLGADDVLYLLVCSRSPSTFDTKVTLEARDSSLKTKWMVDVPSSVCPAELALAPGGIVYTVANGSPSQLLAVQTKSPGPAPVAWSRRFGKDETGNMWIGSP